MVESDRIASRGIAARGGSSLYSQLKGPTQSRIHTPSPPIVAAVERQWRRGGKKSAAR